MARFRSHGEKAAYLFIAIGVYLLLRAVSEARVSSLTAELLYISIAVSLFASNVPRVVDLPLHLVYPLRCVELFTFCLAVAAFLMLCARRFLL